MKGRRAVNIKINFPGKRGGCAVDEEGDLRQTQQRKRECEISDDLEGRLECSDGGFSDFST